MENCYEDDTRADAYAQLGFANTYHLAFRDLPALLAKHIRGYRALDFGCGTGRSTRFLNSLGFDTTGVDIAPEMVAKARALDPNRDYRLSDSETLRDFEDGGFDVILAAFPFDNIAGHDRKVRIFATLGRLLGRTGRLVNIVSTPEIYTHEWASFTTCAFPENRQAHTGDVVRIITTDFGDRRPCEDILWPDEAYRAVYAAAGLVVLDKRLPLATGNEPYSWVSETQTAPWAIYVLGR